MVSKAKCPSHLGVKTVIDKKVISAFGLYSYYSEKLIPFPIFRRSRTPLISANSFSRAVVSLVENLALTQSFEHYNKGIVTATHVGQSMMEMVHSGVRGVILKRGVKKIGFGKGWGQNFIKKRVEIEWGWFYVLSSEGFIRSIWPIPIIAFRKMSFCPLILPEGSATPMSLCLEKRCILRGAS